ncbi:MAG: hypothetical protein ACP5IL_11465 [Syntrophobacteraceae bacterium]
MKVDLGVFQGNIIKTATIQSNDPDKPLTVLKLEGVVKAIVEMKPSPNVSLIGPAARIKPTVVDLLATTAPFHIESVETNLAGSIHYSVKTVTDGTHYRLKISNLLRKGNYSGYIKLKTDMARVPYLLVRVMGVIKDELSASPETVMIGELSGAEPVRSAQVTLTSASDKPFEITGLTYDKTFMKVSQVKLKNQNGFSLTIEPRLEHAKPGSVNQSPLVIKTDIKPDGQASVLVLIFNNTKGG